MGHLMEMKQLQLPYFFSLGHVATHVLGYGTLAIIFAIVLRDMCCHSFGTFVGNILELGDGTNRRTNGVCSGDASGTIR